MDHIKEYFITLYCTKLLQISAPSAYMKRYLDEVVDGDLSNFDLQLLNES